MSIFNSDLSPEGFSKGFDDSAQGKPKSHHGTYRHWKYWVWGNAALDSHNTAYDKGYDWQQAKAAGVFSSESDVTSKQSNPPIQGNASMSNAMSFAHQIELLQNLKQFLSEFQDRLIGASANYQNKVDRLHGEHGLMDETYRDYVEQQLEPTRQMIARLVEHIGDSDIPAVEREIAYLEPKL